jgi:hypothetical protein
MLNATRALLGALFISLTLSACTTSPDDPGDDLFANRRQWQAQGIRDYDVRFAVSCFCVSDYTQPVILHVRNGALVSVTRVSDGGQVPSSTWEGRYYTVDEMFALIADAKAKGAAEVRVSYEPQLRYPATVFIDESVRTADEERWFEMSDLQPR